MPERLRSHGLSLDSPAGDPGNSRWFIVSVGHVPGGVLKQGIGTGEGLTQLREMGPLISPGEFEARGPPLPNANPFRLVFPGMRVCRSGSHCSCTSSRYVTFHSKEGCCRVPSLPYATRGRVSFCTLRSGTRGYGPQARSPALHITAPGDSVVMSGQKAIGKMPLAKKGHFEASPVPETPKGMKPAGERQIHGSCFNFGWGS